MEAIKTCPDLKFDVIYDDGTHHLVKEGIIFEVDGEELVFHNGTNRLNVLFAVTEGALELVDYIGAARMFVISLKRSAPDTPAAKSLEKICSIFCTDSAENQAVFRLGQMDFRASAVDMLRDMADGATDPVSAGLILAADLVETMEVPV